MDMDGAEDIVESQDIAQETPPDGVFIAPSINKPSILSGESYTYHSPIPKVIKADLSTECVLGVDEAGRGPAIGPMVYGLYYLPIPVHHSLLAETHHFDDSKVLTPIVRSQLMEKISTTGTDLFENCGWATRIMSARDISAGQLQAYQTYNLNAQAMDATINLIQEVLDSGVNVREIYIDTIGPPMTYQKKLERIFPAQRITVAKKADSLYPCVSAASVCAKVTRDAALEVLFEAQATTDLSWGSGYPSDARCVDWLKLNMDPVFGWGNASRYSWGTCKELLESHKAPCTANWPGEDDEPDTMKLTSFMFNSERPKQDELISWFGNRMLRQDTFV